MVEWNLIKCDMCGTCLKKKNNFAMYNCLATENKLTGIILDRSPRHVETVAPILHIENDSNKDALQKSAVADRL